MKSGVPMMEPVAVRLVVSRIAAMPKSVRTGRPSDRSRTLAGLTSRCWMSASWAAVSAASTPRPIRAASAGGIGPWASRSAREPPVTNSMTIHG